MENIIKNSTLKRITDTHISTSENTITKTNNVKKADTKKKSITSNKFICDKNTMEAQMIKPENSVPKQPLPSYNGTYIFIGIVVGVIVIKLIPKFFKNNDNTLLEEIDDFVINQTSIHLNLDKQIVADYIRTKDNLKKSDINFLKSSLLSCQYTVNEIPKTNKFKIVIRMYLKINDLQKEIKGEFDRNYSSLPSHIRREFIINKTNSYIGEIKFK